MSLSHHQKQQMLRDWRSANLTALLKGKPLVVNQIGLDNALGFAVWDYIASRLVNLAYNQRHYGDVTEAQILEVFTTHLDNVLFEFKAELSTKREDIAQAVAAEKGLLYGHCCLDGRFYVGTREGIEKAVGQLFNPDGSPA